MIDDRLPLHEGNRSEATWELNGCQSGEFALLPVKCQEARNVNVAHSVAVGEAECFGRIEILTDPAQPPRASLRASHVIETLGTPEAVLVIDETGFLKQGHASCGV